MSFKNVLVWLGKRLTLTVLFFLSFVIVNIVWPLNLKAAPASQVEVMGMLLVVCAVYGLIMAEFALRCHIPTAKKILGLTIFLFGVVTVQSMDESLFFRDFVNIPVPQQWQMMATGLIRALLMALATVWLIPARKALAEEKIDWKQRSIKKWVLIILAVAVVFPGVYEFCGYFIAWQSASVREYYQNGSTIFLPVLLGFQVFRGLIWCGLALLALVITRGKRMEQIFLIGLSMGLLHSVQIIIPSGIMPSSVRYVHLVELFVSITAIGLFASWLLRGKPGTS